MQRMWESGKVGLRYLLDCLHLCGLERITVPGGPLASSLSVKPNCRDEGTPYESTQPAEWCRAGCKATVVFIFLSPAGTLRALSLLSSSCAEGRGNSGTS